VKALKQFKLRQHLDAVIAGIMTSILAILVISYNIVETHDGLAHLISVYYWNQQILEGQLYPKWFEEAWGGLGTLFFTFYNPLVRICSIPFGVLHFPPTYQLKGSIIISLLVNAIGVFKLSRLFFSKNSLGSAVSLFLGVLNPYLIINFFIEALLLNLLGSRLCLG
jgi:uncharacterized membrane protein